MKAEDFLLVYCMVPDKKSAKKIAHHLLSLNLIACANVFPKGQSFYKWKGKLEESAELALILKTKKSLYKKMSKELVQKHPYECPGLCAISFNQAHPPFLKWIHDSLL
ncbi:MAG: divalent-cation tolerance protein CutA [Oligoflexia bacterium]|nr:divalent-cation tolerance protein CutA [Oligoflexia bacterium]